MRNTFKAALLMSTACGLIATPALSQNAAPPPDHYSLDDRGVDVVTGGLYYTATDVVIGDPAQGGLTFERVPTPSGMGRHNWVGTIDTAVSGRLIVSIGQISDQFSSSGYVNINGTGSTLEQIGGNSNNLLYTSSDGVKYYFQISTTQGSWRSGYFLSSRIMPTGERVDYAYKVVATCAPAPNGCAPVNFRRIQGVMSGRGYVLKFNYATNVAPTSPSNVGGWLNQTGAVASNQAIDYCDYTADVCTYSRAWPSVSYGSSGQTSTDQSGRTTNYTYNGSAIATVRFPGSSTDDLAITRDSNGRVSSITDAGGLWTYAYATNGSARTTTITNGATTQIVASSTATNRVTSYQDQLNSITSYTYDPQGRLTESVLPEGNRQQFTYDARGNVTQNMYVPKSGSGLANIVTSATYPATCTNPVICNLPTATTDAAGNVTNYTWDSVHGGPLTITAPAPAPGADRPETRYSYAPQTPYFKNSSGAIVAGWPVTLPTQVSACATGTSCVGGANEVRTTIAYGSAGVANNLLPTSVSDGSGANPSMAVTTTTYTPDGDVETVDGPLAGSDDTTRYRYDNARRVVGVVGPDPDGGGAGLNRAQRLTYSPRGQVTLSETGTTPGYTDTNWASFNPLVRSATVYDDRGRPLLASQQSGAGTTVGVQQVSYDASGRPECTAVRMNPAAWGSLPSSACTATSPGSDGPDRITRTTYDAVGRPLTTTSAYGLLSEELTETVAYTANGQVASLTDGNGNVSIQEYDGFDRPTTLRYPNPTGGGTSTTDYEQVSYDAYGRMNESRTRAGQITTLTLDNLGRVTNVDAPSGTQDTAYTYDNLGRTTSAVIPSVQSITLAWDALGRQSSEYSPTFGTVGYQYDAAGRRTRITWPDGFYAQYDHDLYGALTAIRENGAGAGAGVLATYAYNDLGQPTGITRGNGTTTGYGYDAAGRMTGLSHDLAGSGADVVFGYAFNPAGQIASRTVSNAAYVYAPTTGATSYVINGRNQATEVNGTSVGYDDNRNLITGTGRTYGYDAANRLQTATDGATATFLYDASGRLLRSSGVGPTRYFLYAGAQAIAEYSDQGAVTNRYVPGLGLDGVVASYDGSGTTSRSWLLADERGSVMALADGSGGASTINRYDEYGMPASGNAGRFQYTGQAWLAEAGAYHYRARTYLPQIGRFLQTDPIGYQAGANLYGYVSGDPVNLIDPLGLQEEACVPMLGQICMPPVEVLAQRYRLSLVDRLQILISTITPRVNQQPTPSRSGGRQNGLSFRPFPGLGTSRCRNLRGLMSNQTIQGLLRQARATSLQTGNEEGFLYRIAGNGPQIIPVRGVDPTFFPAEHGIPIGPSNIRRENYVIFHVHLSDGGFSNADAQQIRSGWAGNFAVTPTQGYAVNCR